MKNNKLRYVGVACLLLGALSLTACQDQSTNDVAKSGTKVSSTNQSQSKEVSYTEEELNSLDGVTIREDLFDVPSYEEYMAASDSQKQNFPSPTELLSNNFPPAKHFISKDLSQKEESMMRMQQQAYLEMKEALKSGQYDHQNPPKSSFGVFMPQQTIHYNDPAQPISTNYYKIFYNNIGDSSAGYRQFHMPDTNQHYKDFDFSVVRPYVGTKRVEISPHVFIDGVMVENHSDTQTSVVDLLVSTDTNMAVEDFQKVVANLEFVGGTDHYEAQSEDAAHLIEEAPSVKMVHPYMVAKIQYLINEPVRTIYFVINDQKFDLETVPGNEVEYEFRH